MKAKRDMALQLAKEKASLTTAVRTKQQQMRRLAMKVNSGADLGVVKQVTRLR